MLGVPKSYSTLPQASGALCHLILSTAQDEQLHSLLVPDPHQNWLITADILGVKSREFLIMGKSHCI